MTSTRNMPHVPTRGQHILGVTCALLVAVMWVLSAELVQIAMGSRSGQDKKFEKPYFVTYVSLSAFSVCLFGFFKRSWRKTLYLPPRDSNGFIQLQEMDALDSSTEMESTLGRTGEDDEGYVMAFNAKQVFSIALIIAPLFFLSDWVFTIGLEMTSVASSSTISSLTGLFTLIIGAVMNVERFSRAKLFAAIVTITGVSIIGAYDGKSEGGFTSVKGDVINVLAAIIYSVYTIVLKYKSGPPGTVAVSMLFGIIGAIVMVGAIPGFVILHILEWEPFELPPKRVALMLFVNAWVGTVLSDFLWAKSIVLTTPMIGTLALSLTLPMSIIIDYFFRGVQFRIPYLIGVTLVFTGFIAVNVDEMLERSRSDDLSGAAGASSDG